MSEKFTEFLDQYLPSKDPFWRRFILFWFLFNWRYIYVLFEDSVLFNNSSRIEYVSQIRSDALISIIPNWIYDFQYGVDKGWLVIWNFFFSLIFPILLTRLYYPYIHALITGDTYRQFKFIEKKKIDLFNETTEERLVKLWEENFNQEILLSGRSSAFNRLVNILSSGPKKDIDVVQHFTVNQIAFFKENNYVDFDRLTNDKNNNIQHSFELSLKSKFLISKFTSILEK